MHDQPFNATLAQQLVLERDLPYAIAYKQRTLSTNDDALDGARGAAHHRTVFISDEQAQGRGREGRTWHSEPQRGLTFSVLFRPGWEARETLGFALAVGLAVRDACASFSPLEPKIKWPNDVLVENKKLAGTLVETQIRGNKLGALVVGIGLNVNNTLFPDEVLALATSLQVLGGKPVARERVLAEILAQLDLRYRSFSESGVGGLLADLNRFDALLGEHIEVGAIQGVGAGISAEGALRIRLDSGLERLVHSGTVRRSGSPSPPTSV